MRWIDVIVVALVCITMLVLVPRFVFRVHGKSMNPTLKDGDLVFTWFVVRGNLTGEIVVFHDYADRLIVHRVVKDNGEEILTKGDANPKTDPSWISRDKILGVVVFVIPSNIANLTFLGCVVIIVVAIVYELISWILKEE